MEQTRAYGAASMAPSSDGKNLTMATASCKK